MKIGDVIQMRDGRGTIMRLLVVVVKYNSKWRQWAFRAVEFDERAGWVDERKWWRGAQSQASVVREADAETLELAKKWKNRKHDKAREGGLYDCRIDDPVKVKMRGDREIVAMFDGFTGSGNVKFRLSDGRRGTSHPSFVSPVTGGEDDDGGIEFDGEEVKQ